MTRRAASDPPLRAAGRIRPACVDRAPERAFWSGTTEPGSCTPSQASEIASSSGAAEAAAQVSWRQRDARSAQARHSRTVSPSVLDATMTRNY
jgi:hypothetical protein